mmetsp:Transcript_6353/g.8891  ORF Transcript_6353/g.8891 Transcript_6353/m.8891 type:complete len:176 (+) Transcript_6353:849-1376(+)
MAGFSSFLSEQCRTEQGQQVSIPVHQWRKGVVCIELYGSISVARKEEGLRRKKLSPPLSPSHPTHPPPYHGSCRTNEPTAGLIALDLLRNQGQSTTHRARRSYSQAMSLSLPVSGGPAGEDLVHDEHQAILVHPSEWAQPPVRLLAGMDRSVPTNACMNSSSPHSQSVSQSSVSQ